MLNDDSPRCPECSGKVIEISHIPATATFAGRALSAPLPGGRLYRCRECRLAFKWPRLNKNELDKMYREGNESTWTAEIGSRVDWSTAQQWIKEEVPRGGSILDIGCFDGGFLAALASDYRCFGVEIHASAGKEAEKRGIKIIGNDFTDVSGKFNIVTAFDVIEHVEKPGAFLRGCLRATVPGGYVLISTGNIDAWTFRLMGGCYWYSSIGEHISFVGRRWFAQHAGVLDYRVVKEAVFSHGNASIFRRWRETAVNIFYRVASPGFRALRKLGVGDKDARAFPELADHPPSWGTARDHIIVLLQKL